MEKAIEFMKSKCLVAIACHDAKDVWIANVYFGADDTGTLYFVSPDSNRHSKMILANPNIAFSIPWFDHKNHANRKAIQGLGVCRPAESDEEIQTGVTLHNSNVPEFKETVTVDWVKDNEWNSKVWVIKPTFIKYWDDELYGDDESEEFTLA